jgi:hypothetical protein
MKAKHWIYLIIIATSIFLMGSNCDHGLKPRFTALQGDLIVIGDWPERTEMCFLVATHEKPDQLILDVQLVQGFYQLPDNVFKDGLDSVRFHIEMPPGEYGWIFFAILDSSALSTVNSNMGWRNLAAEYIDPDDESKLGSVVIGEDEIPFVRIVCDFRTPYRGVGNDGLLDYFHLDG